MEDIAFIPYGAQVPPEATNARSVQPGDSAGVMALLGYCHPTEWVRVYNVGYYRLWFLAGMINLGGMF